MSVKQDKRRAKRLREQEELLSRLVIGDGAPSYIKPAEKKSRKKPIKERS